MITRCSNNYGPYQFPEKLIPLFVTNALEDQPLPLYGTGRNVRDWIHVRDHCRGIDVVLREGRPGEVYNIGAGNERTNVDITHAILRLLAKPATLIRCVNDRPGHDFRYALDYSKIRQKLGWKPEIRFERGLADTIDWYRTHGEWVARIKSGEYLRYYQDQYGSRLGN
jgi:dTDP-glucose 4,6-dehydratase